MTYAGAYIHPIAGGLILIFLIYVAVLGLQMRTRKRERARLAEQHARLAPYAFGLMAAVWALGAFSTLALRHDLELASTVHFRIGSAMMLLLAGSSASARYMQRGRPGLRELHPWLGATAVLLAAAQAVTGLQLLP